VLISSISWHLSFISKQPSQQQFFIVHQHDYVCTAQYCYGKSVHPSVTNSIYRQTLSTDWYRYESSLLSVAAVSNPNGNSLSGGNKHTGQENLVKNLRFSKEIAVNLGNGTRYKNQSYKNKGSKFSGKSP